MMAHSSGVNDHHRGDVELLCFPSSGILFASHSSSRGPSHRGRDLAGVRDLGYSADQAETPSSRQILVALSTYFRSLNSCGYLVRVSIPYLAHQLPGPLSFKVPAERDSNRHDILTPESLGRIHFSGCPGHGMAHLHPHDWSWLPVCPF